MHLSSPAFLNNPEIQGDSRDGMPLMCRSSFITAAKAFLVFAFDCMYIIFSLFLSLSVSLCVSLSLPTKWGERNMDINSLYV